MQRADGRPTFSLFHAPEWEALARSCHANLQPVDGGAGIIAQPWSTIRSTAYRKSLSPLLQTLGIADDADLSVLGPWNSCRFVIAQNEESCTWLHALLQPARQRHLALPFLPEPLYQRLAAEFTVQVTGAETYHVLPVSWHTYEEYIGSLPAKIRSSLRSEDRRLRSADSTHGVARGAAALAAIRQLAAQQTPEQADLTRHAAEIFGDAFLAFYVADADGCRAICVAIVHGNELYLRRYVQRPDAARDGYTYFTTVYRAPVEYAVRHECLAVHAGIGAAQVKSARGFASLAQVHCLVTQRL